MNGPELIGLLAAVALLAYLTDCPVKTGVVRMTANNWIQICLFVGVLLATVKPLGWFMSRVFQGQPCGLDRVLGTGRTRNVSSGWSRSEK